MNSIKPTANGRALLEVRAMAQSVSRFLAFMDIEDGDTLSHSHQPVGATRAKMCIESEAMLRIETLVGT
jgi:hypothetical protein